MTATLVLDVGKSNVKLLVIGKDGRILDVVKRNNRPLAGPPYQHIDTEGIWQSLVEGAKSLSGRHEIDTIVPCTHGCAFALIDDNGLVLPMLDYEHSIPDRVAGEYEAIEPPPDETLTPSLPDGLIPGRQLYWLQRDFGEQFGRARWILGYPQYWAWRLTGVAASELTYLGCHAHLWNPRQRCFSSLVERMDWKRLFPPIRPAYERIGAVRAEAAREMGISTECHVCTGIHDANANFGLYLRNLKRPFNLVSTGTWMVLMSLRFPLEQLDLARDTMAIVNILGEPLATGRFMGGREFEMLTAEVDRNTPVTAEDLDFVLRKRSFVLPCFTPGGPYIGRKGSFAGTEPQTAGQTIARALVYVASVTAVSMRMLHMDGDLVIDGGFTSGPWFAPLLAAISGAGATYVNRDTQGTAMGAGMLAIWEDQQIDWPLSLQAIEPFQHPELSAYCAEWESLIS